MLFHTSNELDELLEVLPALSLLELLESKLLLELLELEDVELLDVLDEDCDTEELDELEDIELSLGTSEELLELLVLLELETVQATITVEVLGIAVPSHVTLPVRPLEFLSLSVIEPVVPAPIATKRVCDESLYTSIC